MIRRPFARPGPIQHVDLQAVRGSTKRWIRVRGEDLSVADSEGSLAPRGPLRVWHALRWSLNGLRQCWKLESSFRLEVYLFLPLAPLAWWLGQGTVERVLLIGSMLLVIAAEVMNSAIEAVVDRWGPEWHELAGRAKDMGSAAVFLLMMNVVFTWAVLLWPRIAG